MAAKAAVHSVLHHTLNFDTVIVYCENNGKAPVLWPETWRGKYAHFLAMKQITGPLATDVANGLQNAGFYQSDTTWLAKLVV